MADLRFVFYGVNLVFCLIGGVMLGVGIWMAVDTEDAEEAFAMAGLNEDLYWASVYFMITIGCLVLIVSFVGMVGATKVKGALFAFIGVVCLILILELIMIIMTGVFWDSIDAGTQEQMQDEVQNQYVNEYANDSISMKWNNMQIDWKCCGSREYNDYDDSYYKRETGLEVPWTCCVMKVEGGRTLEDVLNVDACRTNAEEIEIIDTSDFLHTRGCYSRLNDVLEGNSILMIALTVAFIALEVGGLVIAFMLVRD